MNRSPGNSLKKGFSLLEVMAAIVIVSIVLIPLIFMFKTSKHDVLLEREMFNATLMAQSILNAKIYEYDNLYDLPVPGVLLLPKGTLPGKYECVLQSREVRNQLFLVDVFVSFKHLRKKFTVNLQTLYSLHFLNPAGREDKTQ